MQADGLEPLAGGSLPLFFVRCNGRGARRVDKGMALAEAAAAAVRGCTEDGILEDCLTRHGSEVCNMLLQEWSTEDFARVRAEEASVRAHLEDARRMLARGFDVADIAAVTELPEAEIRELQRQGAATA